MRVIIHQNNYLKRLLYFLSLLTARLDVSLKHICEELNQGNSMACITPVSPEITVVPHGFPVSDKTFKLCERQAATVK